MESIESIIHNKKYVLYQDKNFLVLNKPCGYSCNLNDNNSDLFFINRLDTPVTGCVVIALNPEYCSKLSKIFLNRERITKTYLAIIEGQFKTSEKILIDNYITFDSKKQKAFVADEPKRKSKNAKLFYQCIGFSERYSFFEIELVTGRTHQIRAQLSHAGFHIKGDLKYGARRSEKGGGIRLHSYKIEFPHPDTNVMLSLTAPIPDADVLWQLFLDEAENGKKK
jgi:23S rRNA pseudouridine1911/1915/1917 synthase